MTRARTQLLLLAVYAGLGLLALLAPGFILDFFGASSADRTPIALLMTRALGAACLGVGLALFFFIADAAAGRKLMRVLAGGSVGAVVAAILSLGADDLSTRAGLLPIVVTAALALLNFYGGFIAPIHREQTPDTPEECETATTG